MGPFEQKICSKHCKHYPALVNSLTSTMLCVRLSAEAEMVWADSKMCGNPFFFSFSVRNSNYESQTLYSHHLYQLQLAQSASIWPMLDETWENVSHLSENRKFNIHHFWKFFQVMLFFFLFLTFSSSPVQVQGSSLDDGSSWRVAVLLWGSGGCLISSSSLKLNQPAGESSHQPAYLMLETPTTNEWTLAED